jgi:hypothetical protein
VGTGQRSHAASGEPGSEKKGFCFRKCCRAEKLMRGTVLSGPWSTWDGGGRGKRRSKTLRWRRSAREEKPCCFEKNGGGFQEPKTRWSRDNPRTDGGEASHTFPRFSGLKNSEAHENHWSGERSSVTILRSSCVSLTPRKADPSLRYLSPRVCAPGEPKPERRELVPDHSRGFSRSTTTGNGLSETGSQGLRK